MIVKIFENFTEDVKEMRNIILRRAIETSELSVVKSFVKRGYDINGDDILVNAAEDIDIFTYMLEKKIDIQEGMDDYYFRDKVKHDVDVQKALIDAGYEMLVYDKVGFHFRLREDKKYADIVDMVEDMKKYNM